MKKKILLFIYLISICFFILGEIPFDKKNSFREDSYSLNQARWIEPVNISNSSVNSLDPQVVTDQNSKAYVVWVEEGYPRRIYFNTNENEEWEAPQDVSREVRISASGPWPDLVIDNTGRSHLVYTARGPNTYDIFYNNYNKGWSNNLNVSETHTGGSARPALDVNPTNLFCYAVWMDDQNNPDRWELFFRYKDPNASHWSNVNVLPISPSAYAPEIAVDGKGKAHLIWIRRSGGSSVVWYSKNSDSTNKNTWTDPVAISGQTQVDFCWPKINSDYAGGVYVIWENMSEGNSEIFFLKNVNETWESIKNISNTAGNSIKPDIAVGKNSGNIYVVWQERTNNWQVFFKYYQNGQWSKSINLTSNSSASINPSLWVDDEGEIHLVYADNFRGPYEIMYTSTKEIAPQVYPPINVFLESKLDNSQTEKINILSWEENPENKNLEIINYKIYRREVEQKDDEYILIKSVTGETFEYEDKNLPTTKKYSYSLTAVAQGGYESEASEWVTEEKVFPPINITLNTEINSSLFSDEKINIIRWNKNPLNDAITVINYKIYRKKSDQEDKHYELISTKDANTFEYMDRNLHLEKKFTYMMTVIDRDGNVSKKSASVSEN